jgi:hypothetical protein
VRERCHPTFWICRKHSTKEKPGAWIVLQSRRCLGEKFRQQKVVVAEQVEQWSINSGQAKDELFLFADVLFMAIVPNA